MLVLFYLEECVSLLVLIWKRVKTRCICPDVHGRLFVCGFDIQVTHFRFGMFTLWLSESWGKHYLPPAKAGLASCHNSDEDAYTTWVFVGDTYSHNARHTYAKGCDHMQTHSLKYVVCFYSNNIQSAEVSQQILQNLLYSGFDVSTYINLTLHMKTAQQALCDLIHIAALVMHLLHLKPCHWRPLVAEWLTNVSYNCSVPGSTSAVVTSQSTLVLCLYIHQLPNKSSNKCPLDTETTLSDGSCCILHQRSSSFIFD